MSKTILIIILLIISAVSFYFYFSNKLPPGIEAKGNETTIAIISLLTAIVSLCGTMLTFILKIMEVKSERRNIN